MSGTEFLWFVLIGVCAGWLAHRLSSGRGAGLLASLVVGCLGAIVGGFLFDQVGLKVTSRLGVFISAIVGSLILITLLTALESRRHRQ